MTSRDQPELERATPRQPDAGEETAAGTGRPPGETDAPILASKITVPAVADWVVQRPRVSELIAAGIRRCPLTVLTGPPGAGKTMTLALWTAAETGPVAWVGLDEFDNPPETFWSYVVAALRRCGVAVPLVGTGREQDGGHAFVLRLAAELAAQDPPVTLVLDDLHLLADPGVLKGLDFVLRNVGTGLRLMVASRMDPLLPLHRYRVAGRLTEIRADDLAFSAAEAGLLLAQHGIALSAESLEILTCRTEGWAAGLRLAALSMGAHPDPDQFVKELSADDSALTGYLVDEVLNAQPPQTRAVLLYTSILEQVSTDAAVELTGDEGAAAIFSAAARANAFIQPIGSGRYRYHTLFGQVLRLKLRHEDPDQVAVLHGRAARWYGRNGLLPDAVRHAAQAGDWPLAASLVIDGLAIGDIIEPGESLADEFRMMPIDRAWAVPQPHLVSAAVALSAGRNESCASALEAADSILARVPADEEPTARLAAATIHLAAAVRTGDLAAAASAAASAELVLGQVPGEKLTRRPDATGRVQSARGVIELWSGRLDEAARIFQAGMAAMAAAGGQEPAECAAQLALTEALRGRLRRAAELADRVAATRAAGSHDQAGQIRHPAALVALALVHLERDELRETRRCLKQADDALGTTPDRLIGAVAYLVAAGGAMAEGRAAVAAQVIARARAGSPLPAWLDQRLSLVQSRAAAAAGDNQAALAAAKRVRCDDSLEAAVTLAHIWTAAGDDDSARRALAPALAADREAPDQVRVLAWLADARLSYASGDRARGRRSLAASLRLAEPEQLRMPFVAERNWMGPVLRKDAQLAEAHRRLLAPVLGHEELPAAIVPGQPPVLLVEPLSKREQEVLQHISRMLSTAEVATEMYLSVNTVKTHLRTIYRKLAAAHRGEAVRRARQMKLI